MINAYLLLRLATGLLTCPIQDTFARRINTKWGALNKSFHASGQKSGSPLSLWPIESPFSRYLFLPFKCFASSGCSNTWWCYQIRVSCKNTRPIKGVGLFLFCRGEDLFEDKVWGVCFIPIHRIRFIYTETISGYKIELHFVLSRWLFVIIQKNWWRKIIFVHWISSG